MLVNDGSKCNPNITRQSFMHGFIYVWTRFQYISVRSKKVRLYLRCFLILLTFQRHKLRKSRNLVRYRPWNARAPCKSFRWKNVWKQTPYQKSLHRIISDTRQIGSQGTFIYYKDDFWSNWLRSQANWKHFKGSRHFITSNTHKS